MTTKNKKQSTEVTQLVDPRAAMKLVRSEVKNAVAGNHRVDEMGYTDRDVARSQIALQDMLTKEQVKRRKAEGHIIELKSILDILSILSTMVTNDSTNRLLRDQTRITELSSEINEMSSDMKALYEENHRLSQGWQESMANHDVTLDKLAAAMQTIKTMAEGTDLA